MLQYIVKICALVKWRSIWIARSASRMFRLKDFCGVRKSLTQLLGQCAGALGLAPFKDVHNRRTNNAQDINAEVALKMAVFNRDNGFAKDGRNLIVSHHHPSLQRKAADHGAVAGIKLRRNVGPKIKKLTDLRQVGGIHKDQTRERPRTNCQKN